MEIKIIEKNKEKAKFLVKGINHTIANTIRRGLWEIPVLAIDNIEISKNDSALFDETIAHRLGLTVLEQDEGLVPKEECKCKGKGCSKCTVKFKLEARGPKMVKVEEFKGSSIKAIYPKTPIVWLEPGQEIAMNIEASLGYGKNHAKYLPGILSYRSYPKLETEGKVNLEKAVKSCPKKALSIKNNRLVLDETKCDACEECVEKSDGKIKINLSETDFIFEVETFGGFSTKEIFIKSIEAVNKNLKEIEKQIK